jgi:hypothetical protein
VKRITKKKREATACELACDYLEEYGCEVDMKNCFADDVEPGGSVWVTLRVLVPDLNIEERVEHNAKLEKKA